MMQLYDLDCVYSIDGHVLGAQVQGHPSIHLLL